VAALLRNVVLPHAQIFAILIGLGDLVDLNCAVDILRDAVQAGMLPHTTYGTSGCSVDTYLKTIVAVFIEGVRKS
jgi:hypothetical protein